MAAYYPPTRAVSTRLMPHTRAPHLCTSPPLPWLWCPQVHPTEGHGKSCERSCVAPRIGLCLLHTYSTVVLASYALAHASPHIPRRVTDQVVTHARTTYALSRSCPREPCQHTRRARATRANGSHPAARVSQISSCGFGGLAWMPGTQTWLLSDPWNGINDRRGGRRSKQQLCSQEYGQEARKVNIIGHASSAQAGRLPPDSEQYL